MPIYDYECEPCGHIFERIDKVDDDGPKTCPLCKKRESHRIISATGVYCGNQDTTWLKTVGEVVGTETREGREFLKNPTRDNRRAWMNAKGLMPYEPGMRMKPEPIDMTSRRVTDQLARMAMDRRRIEIRG